MRCWPVRLLGLGLLHKVLKRTRAGTQTEHGPIRVGKGLLYKVLANTAHGIPQTLLLHGHDAEAWAQTAEIKAGVYAYWTVAHVTHRRMQ